MANEKKDQGPRMVTGASNVDQKHPSYEKSSASWQKIRDCMEGEDTVKGKGETYLPRPGGMSGEYADAYDPYKERAHFPLITSYALSGALGIVVTKLPEFNVPKELEYLVKEATKDGRSLSQLFLDIIIEIFQTGRVPILVDIVEDNEFRFVQYKAESFINWKTNVVGTEKSLILGVLEESRPQSTDIYSHDSDTVYRVLSLTPEGKFMSELYAKDSKLYDDSLTVPEHMGTTINEIPLFVAGSINNSFDMQPIPLTPVANCSVQIYRKEADLANSEYLSCNPTLCVVGATNDDDLPNVVGSSVMMVIPNEQARVFYTKTDTAALTHVKSHISDLYDEAIRHGVAILDARKGVEAAEALRIRQATQSASIYSIYLAALNALKQGIVLMCKWGGYNADEVVIDAPTALTQGIPDPSVLKEIIEGYGQTVVPMTVIHRYLVTSGLLDQNIGYEEYIKLLAEDSKMKKDNGEEESSDDDLSGGEGGKTSGDGTRETNA